MTKQLEPPSLPLHEWTAVLSLIVLFLILITISQILPAKSSDLSLADDNTHILCTLEGAVKNRGTFQFRKGVTLKEVLDRVGVSIDADLEELNLGKRFNEDQFLLIKEKQFIEVYLEGAVAKKGALRVPKGTHLKTLLEKSEIYPNGDIKALGLLKRKLVPGEVIKIPEKK